MTVHLLTFATNDRPDRGGRGVRRYRAEAERLCTGAINFGLSPMIGTEEFVRSTVWGAQHKDLLDKPQFGYSAWKPFIILGVMEYVVADGEFLIYSDSNHILLSDPAPYIGLAAEHDIFVHDHRPFATYPCKEWATIECLRRMDADREPYWSYPQLHANFHIWHKVPRVRQFLMEWLEACGDEKIVGWNQGDTAAGYPGFREHRNEQAVLSLLACKWQLPVFPEPYQVLYDEQEIYA